MNTATPPFEDNVKEQVHVTVTVKWVKDDKRRKQTSEGESKYDSDKLLKDRKRTKCVIKKR